MLGTRRALLGGNQEINVTCPAITPTLGAELIVNGNFAAWTGDDPDNWTVANEDASNYVTESGAGGQARIVSDNTKGVKLYQNVLTVNWHRIALDVIASSGGGIALFDGGTSIQIISSVASHLLTYRATGANLLQIFRNLTCDVTFDNVSAKVIAFSSMITLLGQRSQRPGTYICHPTVTVGTQCGILISYANSNNFVMALVNRQAGQAQLIKCINGTYTNVIAGAITYSAAAELKVVIAGNGTDYSLYYTGAQVGTTQAITDVGLGKAIYGFNTLSGNSVGIVTTS